MKPKLTTRILKYLLITSAAIATVIALIWMVLQGYSTPWTGFGDFTKPDGDITRGKTLWDWMQLFIIPLFLSIGVFFLNQSERNNEREIALDRQREAALQSYLDRMADLLLKEKLRTTRNKETRNVARTRTLTVLRGLDANRKGLVLRFLYEAGLVGREKPVINLAGADLSFLALNRVELSGADLRNTDLSNANLNEIYLDNADLSRAKLSNAKLFNSNLTRANLYNAYLDNAHLNYARLESADLRGADLHNAHLIYTVLCDGNLSDAYLKEADLRRANIKGADLNNAELEGANMRGALVSEEQLTTASLKGATLPDGTIHD